MKYSPRPGIVRTTICDLNVLIPSREASGECHKILQLSFIGAIIWGAIENGLPIEKAVETLRIIYKRKTKEQIEERIENYCQYLYKNGFVILSK